MDTLLHLGGALVTIVFLGAVVYSFTSTWRKRRAESKREQELVTKQHVQVKNLHQYDVKPVHGRCVFPIDTEGELKRLPKKFTALSILLANDQPYSICLLALVEFENGAIKDGGTKYFYIQPPENNLSNLKGTDLTWDLLRKADKFGEYWEAGLAKCLTGKTLVMHNAPYVMGCIMHALQVYGITPPPMQYIDTLHIAKKHYNFKKHHIFHICSELGLEYERENALHEAISLGKFLLHAAKDYPMYLPTIHYVNAAPSEQDRWASVISLIEREECTAEEIFSPNPPDMAMIQTLLAKKYIEPGDTPNTYYATDAGLDFAESL